MQALHQIQVVLVEPAHPGNIGATARAMANMGLSQLILVNPQQFPHEAATARAAGADHILQNARVCQHIDEALADSVFVMGTTARSRRTAWPVLTPGPAMRHVSQLVAQKQVPIAICFGRERTGLTNEELERCHSLIWIPVDAQFSSLNLGSAVTVVLYELRRVFLEAEMNLRVDNIENTLSGDIQRGQQGHVLDDVQHNRQSIAQNDVIGTDNLSLDSPLEKMRAVGDEPLASAKMLRDFYAHLETVLYEIEFFDGRSSKLLRKFTRLFNRAHMTEKEVSMLRGVLSEVQRKLK